MEQHGDGERRMTTSSKYRTQAPDGSAGTPVTAGWDVVRNQPI
jgi:hypothetical protein